MSSQDRFLDKVSNFTPVTAKEAEELVDQQAGHVIFVARETCPYCCRFINKLHKVSQQEDVDVYYLKSDDEKDLENISNFREKHQLATVPSLVYSNTNGVKTVSDSTLSIEEISDFIEA